jgi:phosphopantetheinyl transferase
MMPAYGQLALAAGEAHLWCLDTAGDPSPSWLGLLPAEERHDLEQHGPPATIRQRLVARAMLRLALSVYDDSPPGMWKLVAGPAGKPELHGNRPWTFNISHTERLVAVIISRSRAVGVDAEALSRRLPHAEDLVLSPWENRAIERATPARRRELFFYFWTIKEALGKGLGDGLGLPLDQMTIRNRGQSIRLIDHARTGVVSGWRLGSLRLPRHRVSWACAPMRRAVAPRLCLWHNKKLSVYRIA